MRGSLRGPVNEPALAADIVLEEALVAALPSGHPLGARKRLGLAMLAKEPFVLPARSRGPGFHDQILAMCRTAGFSPRVVQEVPRQMQSASSHRERELPLSRRPCASFAAPASSTVRCANVR